MGVRCFLSAISDLELGDFGFGGLGALGVEVVLGNIRPMQSIPIALRTESVVRWQDLG